MRNPLMVKIQKSIATLLIVIVCAVCVTTAWAALSIVKTKDALVSTETLEKGMFQPLGVEELAPISKPKSRAPEPSTMALFGSGIMGMIVSMVRKTYAAMKRALDVVAAILGIVFLSPLFMLTAIAIKLTSRGPVLFKQTRVGKDGQLFEIFKFRTMKVDAEKETGPVWAKERDPRLIPIGQFLRKAHIDEIPQFFNILNGDMSLIGPRPERPVFVEKFTKEIPDYTKRLSVKPGLTGLAQVWHKYDETIEDVKKKIKYDILYIKKFCLWTDLRIFFRTFRVVLTGEGAR